MQIDKGQYAYTEFDKVPRWYLHHVLCGIADVKWEGLTPEEQQGVRDELARRDAPVPENVPAPVEELTASSETSTQPEPQPVEDAPTPSEPEPSSPATEPEPAPEPAPAPSAAVTVAAADTTPGSIATVNGETALSVIASTSTLAELDALEADERASEKHPGGRKGVLGAIEDRRKQLSS